MNTDPARIPVPALLTLANAYRPRRAAGAAGRQVPDPLTTAAAATELLASLDLAAPVTGQDLPVLRRLTEEVGAVAEAIAADQEPPRGPPTLLNDLSREALGHYRLEPGHDHYHADLEWLSASPAAELARRVIVELGRLDPARLRSCARAQCTLLFYDSSRPGTQRWHAESPCGIRERQVRYRRSIRDTHA